MALSDITVTVSAEDYVFKIASTDGPAVQRLDTEHGNLALPLAMSTSRQDGSISKPDRHLIRFDMTKRDATTGAVATVSAHTVLTVPRSSAVSLEDAVLCYELLRTFLTTANATNIIKGQLP